MDYRPKIKLTQDEFRVLASDTRIDILKLLDESQFTVSDISRRLNMNKATVHEHLTKLMEVGLVSKDDSPRKWVYYRLTWKGKNLLHPERVKVMVSLGIMMLVLVVGALIIASTTDIIMPDDDDDGDDTPTLGITSHVFWGAEQLSGTYDINFAFSSGVSVTTVEELSAYLESGPTSITRWEPLELTWSKEGDVIHLYDTQGLLDGHEGEYLYVEGTVRDDRGQERTFALRRYLPPSDCVIDLRISELSIDIDTTNLSTREMVTITFEVENAGTLDVEHAPVEVFSVRNTFRAPGFPSYGSPYLYLIHEELVSVPVNGSATVTFDVTSRNLYTKGIMVVVDPDNQMPEDPSEDNTATSDLPQDVVEINSMSLAKPAADAEERATVNLGYMAIVVVVVIIALVLLGAVLYLRRQE